VPWAPRVFQSGRVCSRVTSRLDKSGAFSFAGQVILSNRRTVSPKNTQGRHVCYRVIVATTAQRGCRVSLEAWSATRPVKRSCVEKGSRTAGRGCGAGILPVGRVRLDVPPATAPPLTRRAAGQGAGEHPRPRAAGAGCRRVTGRVGWLLLTDGEAGA